jgi:hypothetical protein
MCLRVRTLRRKISLPDLLVPVIASARDSTMHGLLDLSKMYPPNMLPMRYPATVSTCLSVRVHETVVPLLPTRQCTYAWLILTKRAGCKDSANFLNS